MSQQPLDVVQSAYAAFGSGDVPGLLALVDDDVDWEVVGRQTDYPTFRKHEGRDAVGDFFRVVGENEKFEKFEPTAFHPSGDTVVVELDLAFTFTHNGKPVAGPVVHIFTVRDGKIVRFREFQDTARAVEAYRA